MSSPSPARHALFPGTFDPFTLGHFDVARRAHALFGRVTVVVADHPTKRQLFDVPERCELIREVLAELEGTGVIATSGLLVDACQELGADVVVRGVRSAADLEYESRMAHANRAMLPSLDTIFLAPSPGLSHISSTLVRQIASMGGDVSSFVPPRIAEAMHRLFSTS